MKAKPRQSGDTAQHENRRSGRRGGEITRQWERKEDIKDRDSNNYGHQSAVEQQIYQRHASGNEYQDNGRGPQRTRGFEGQSDGYYDQYREPFPPKKYF